MTKDLLRHGRSGRARARPRLPRLCAGRGGDPYQRRSARPYVAARRLSRCLGSRDHPSNSAMVVHADRPMNQNGEDQSVSVFKGSLPRHSVRQFCALRQISGKIEYLSGVLASRQGTPNRLRGCRNAVRRHAMRLLSKAGAIARSIAAIPRSRVAQVASAYSAHSAPTNLQLTGSGGYFIGANGHSQTVQQ